MKYLLERKEPKDGCDQKEEKEMDEIKKRRSVMN